MDLHKFGSAMLAMEHIIKTKEGRFVDNEILLMLSGPVCDAVRKNKDDHLGKRFGDLIEKLTQTTATNPVLWEAAARLADAQDNVWECLAYREKQCRAMQTDAAWLDDPDRFVMVVEGVQDLVTAYMKQGSKESLHSAKIHVQNTIDKAVASAAVQSHPGVDQLRQLLPKLAVPATPVSVPAGNSEAKASAAYSDWA